MIELHLGVIEMDPFIIVENRLGEVDPRMETKVDKTGPTPRAMTHGMKGGDRNEVRARGGRMTKMTAEAKADPRRGVDL